MITYNGRPVRDYIPMTDPIVLGAPSLVIMYEDGETERIVWEEAFYANPAEAEACALRRAKHMLQGLPAD